MIYVNEFVDECVIELCKRSAARVADVCRACVLLHVLQMSFCSVACVADVVLFLCDCTCLRSRFVLLHVLQMLSCLSSVARVADVVLFCCTCCRYCPCVAAVACVADMS